MSIHSSVLYAKTYHGIKYKYSTQDFGELAKYTSMRYAEMDDVEKDDWNQREEADKARYLHELSEYIPPPGFDKNGDAIKPAKPKKPKKTKGGKIRDPNAPKKCVSAYIMYQNAMRSSFKSENPGMVSK